jgi:hypothetical protein
MNSTGFSRNNRVKWILGGLGILAVLAILYPMLSGPHAAALSGRITRPILTTQVPEVLKKRANRPLRPLPKSSLCSMRIRTPTGRLSTSMPFAHIWWI